MADEQKTLGETIGFPGAKPKKKKAEGEGFFGAATRYVKRLAGMDDAVPAAQPSSAPSKKPDEAE